MHFFKTSIAASFFIAFVPCLVFSQAQIADSAGASESVKEEKIQETLPAEEETNLVDDLELIAVITAAIAASEGGDPGQYIVRSIKKVHRNQW